VLVEPLNLCYIRGRVPVTTMLRVRQVSELASGDKRERAHAQTRLQTSKRSDEMLSFLLVCIYVLAMCVRSALVRKLPAVASRNKVDGESGFLPMDRVVSPHEIVGARSDRIGIFLDTTARSFWQANQASPLSSGIGVRLNLGALSILQISQMRTWQTSPKVGYSWRPMASDGWTLWHSHGCFSDVLRELLEERSLQLDAHSPAYEAGTS
jgi:hypothetical protein